MSKPREVLAGWVGAESWDDYKNNLKARAEKQEQKSQELRHFPQGVPDLLRSTFLTLHKPGNYVHKHTPALIVYELWHEAMRNEGISSAIPITVNQITEFALKIGRDTAQKIVRRGIMQLTGLGFFRQTTPKSGKRGRRTTQYVANPLNQAIKSFQNNLMYRLRENIFKGKIPDTVTANWFPMLPEETAQKLAEHENQRRTHIYEENSAAIVDCEIAYKKAVEKMLSVSDLDTLLNNYSTPLQHDGGTWRNGNEFTRFFYAIQARPRIQSRTPISRKKAAELLGISPKTVSGYREEMGIGITPLYRSFDFNATSEVLAKIDHRVKWAAGRYSGRRLVSTSGNTVEIRPGLEEYLDEWMKREIGAGHQVVLDVQYSSQERAATEEEKKTFAQRIRRRKSQAIERYRDRHQEKLDIMLSGNLKLREPPPPKAKTEEICPLAFTQGYIDQQLALNGRDPFYMWAFLYYGAVADSERDLIPFLPFLNPSDAYKGKKGNKEDTEPPDTEDTDENSLDTLD